MGVSTQEALKLAQDWYDSGNENPDDFADMIKQVIALAEQPAQRCPLCNYQHGHAIGCENNPVDIALAKMAEQSAPVQQEPKKDLMYSTVAMQERHAALVDRVVATLEQAKRKALAEQPAQQHIEHCLWARNGNTPCPHVQPAQQQEPVALDVTVEGDAAKLLASMLEPVCDDEPTPIRLLVGKGHSGRGLYVASAEYQEEGAALLVNTSPPASKPWVGLTDEQRRETINRAWNDYLRWEGDDSFSWYLSQAIEAKLKEKNNG